ncbi:MAG: ATP-binding cassette domain-containing protein [Tepidisphaeraceae bacterium]
MSIEVKNITKTFGSFTALNDVSLRVNQGELVALLGPSGSGKTTLLRIIAGLEVPDEGAGTVSFNDEAVTGQHVSRRNVGFVFQHYALFKNMTVFENVAFGLRVQTLEPAPRPQRDPRQCRTPAQARPTRRPRQAIPAATLRRPASARRPRPSTRRRAESAAARRTLRRARRQSPA